MPWKTSWISSLENFQCEKERYLIKFKIKDLFWSFVKQHFWFCFAMAWILCNFLQTLVMNQISKLFLKPCICGASRQTGWSLEACEALTVLPARPAPALISPSTGQFCASLWCLFLVPFLGLICQVLDLAPGKIDPIDQQDISKEAQSQQWVLRESGREISARSNIWVPHLWWLPTTSWLLTAQK